MCVWWHGWSCIRRLFSCGTSCSADTMYSTFEHKSNPQVLPPSRPAASTHIPPGFVFTARFRRPAMGRLFEKKHTRKEVFVFWHCLLGRNPHPGWCARLLAAGENSITGSVGGADEPYVNSTIAAINTPHGAHHSSPPLSTCEGEERNQLREDVASQKHARMRFFSTNKNQQEFEFLDKSDLRLSVEQRFKRWSPLVHMPRSRQPTCRSPILAWTMTCVPCRPRPEKWWKDNKSSPMCRPRPSNACCVGPSITRNMRVCLKKKSEEEHTDAPGDVRWPPAAHP